MNLIKSTIIKLVLVLGCCFSLTAFTTLTAANEPIVLGKTYPILEDDLLEFIKMKAEAFTDDKYEKFKNKSIKNIKKKIIRPTALKHITSATTEKTWNYDPSIIVPFDLSDERGIIFAHAGDKVNRKRIAIYIV